MIGRGLLSNPQLASIIKTGECETNYHKNLKDFHDEIYEGLSVVFSGEKDTMMHMKELWSYLKDSFPGKEKDIKRLMKTKEPTEYKAIVRNIFD